jgi:hypothetical protein
MTFSAVQYRLTKVYVNFVLSPNSAHNSISFPEPAILGKEREALG